MTKIEVLDPFNTHMNQYPEDINRMVKVMANNGFEATRDQAARIWELYSDSCSAGWIGLPKDDEDLFMSLSQFFRVA